MMKKWLSLVVAGLGLISVNAQDLTFSKGKEHEFTITPVGPDDCAMYMTNNTGKPLVIAYEKISVDCNPSWMISLCDNVNCYSEFVQGDTFTTVAANETVNLKISVMSMGKADTATIKYAVWNKYASAVVKDTLVWTIYMPQSAAVREENMVLSAVFPNPTSDFVILPRQATDIRLFDAKGGAVQDVTWADNRLNLSMQASGIYIVRYRLHGTEVSQQIIRK